MEKKAFPMIVLLAVFLFVSGTLGIPANAAAGFYQSSFNVSTPDPSYIVPAPDGVTIDATYRRVNLYWNTVPGAARYNIYRSETQGFGYKRVGEVTHSNWSTHYQFSNTNLTNQTDYYYVITTVNTSGQESSYSIEVNAMPFQPFTWAGTLYPKKVTHTMGALSVVTVDGEFHMLDYANGGSLTGRQDLTRVEPPYNGFKPVEGVIAQLGYGPLNLPPTQWTNWVDASFFGGWLYMPDPMIENPPDPHDRYRAQFVPNLDQAELKTDDQGIYTEFGLIFRFSSSKGREWIYGSEATIEDPNTVISQSSLGILKVYIPQDNPALVLHPPTNLHASVFDETTITLLWEAPELNEEEAKNLYKYQIRRSQKMGGPYTVVGTVPPTATQFTDTNLIAGTPYYYVVCSLNFNLVCSDDSNEWMQATKTKIVSVTINVTVPTFTPTDQGIYLSEINEALGTVTWQGKKLTQIGPSLFRTTFTLPEGQRYNFRISRGSQNTIQTLADGNSPAYDPSFTVKGDASNKQVVAITVTNWEDPLVISYSPAHQAVVKGTATILVVWNQSMPASTTFKVVDIHANNANVSGKFSLDITGQVLTFTPVQGMIGNHMYQVTVSQQPDKQSPKPVTQLTQKTWSFTVQPYQMYLPITRR